MVVLDSIACSYSLPPGKATQIFHGLKIPHKDNKVGSQQNKAYYTSAPLTEMALHVLIHFVRRAQGLNRFENGTGNKTAVGWQTRTRGTTRTTTVTTTTTATERTLYGIKKFLLIKHAHRVC